MTVCIYYYVIIVIIACLSLSANLEQENKLLYRTFLVMESIMKELDIAREPYCAAELV